MAQHRRFAVLARLAAATALVLTGLVTVGVSSASALNCPSLNPDGTLITPVNGSVDWSGCSLVNANLSGVNLSGSSLDGVDFTGANLSHASMVSSNLNYATIRSANLDYADLTNAFITTADFTGSSMAWVKHAGWIVDDLTQFPTGYGLWAGTAWWGASSYMQGQTFSPDIFNNLPFTASIVGSDISNSLWTGIGIRGSNFNSTLLDGATFTGVGMSTTSVDGVTANKVSFADSTFDTDTFRKDTFTASSFARSTLTTVNFDQSALAGVDFTGVHASGIVGTPKSLPAGWTITGGYLVGPGADLHGFNLSDRSLQKRNLSGTNFTQANLRNSLLGAATFDNADFSGADLTGADLTDASFTNATWTGATCPDGLLNNWHVDGTCLSAQIGTPSAPTSVGATFADGVVTVSWNAPANNGGAAISSYTVSEKNGLQVRCITTNLHCQYVIDTTGGSFTFNVIATNQAGDSTAASVDLVVAPATAPDAPNNVTAAPGHTSVAVSWTAPANDGGRPITSYKVTGSGGQSCGTTVGVDANPLTCTVTGLTDGSPYTFTVQATNDLGTSVASATSNSATPAHAPDAPTGLVAVAAAGKVKLTWLAPVSNGGAAVTSYKVTASDGVSSCTTKVGTDANPLTCTIAGLKNGTPYTFTVTATNWAGASVASGSSNLAVPTTIPGAPLKVKVTFPKAKTATLSWAKPATDGGAKVVRYEYCLAKCTSNASWKGVAAPGGTPLRSLTLKGLTKKRAYTVALRAVNANGAGKPTTTKFKQAK